MATRMRLPPFLFRSAPWGGAALSGLLLALCFAPWENAHLVWFALLPLLAALWTLPPDAPRWKAPLLGYTFGLVFFTTSFHWLASLANLFANPALLGLPLLLALYLALYPALWCRLVAFPPMPARTPVGTSFVHIRFALLGAAAWVALDWLRGYLLTGFGWNPPGVALHQNLVLIQIADLFGVHGVSLLVVFANLSFALVARRLLRERSLRAIPAARIEIMAVLLLVCASISYGARALLNPKPAPLEIRAALLQPNQPQDVLFENADESRVFSVLDRLMTRLTSETAPPDLVLWPESATPRGIFADETNHRFVLDQAKRTPAALLVGSVEPSPLPGSQDFQIHNSAILLSNQAQPLQSYRKRHLVPFGEFLPFRSWFPYPRPVLDLVPGDIAPGSEANLLTLEKPGLRIGALVCFEDSLAREARSLARAGANLLVNLTNDAWFGTSAGAAQHLANARFRAIESRLPLLRCANTGISAWIAPSGRIVQSLPPFTEDFLIADPIRIHPNPPLSPHTLWGESWIWICALAALRLALTPPRRVPTPPAP
ncbi:MAG: hypothetical protein RLZZ142_448 [Verrucomicrobiota bacterium]